MDSLVTKLKTPSPHHKVELEGAGFTLAPIDDSDSALEDFQVVAEEALHYSGNTYKVMGTPAQAQRAGYCSIKFKQLKPD